MRVNKHIILVRRAKAQVVDEIRTWGEAAWWPRGSLMRFTRLTEGPVGIGTRYRQKVQLPFAPSWDGEVTGMTGDSITRSFLNGMFSGSETVSAAAEADATRVTYVMTYDVYGAGNKVLWPLLLMHLHNMNIRRILKNLKRHCERKGPR